MKLSTHLLFGAALSAGCLTLMSVIGATPVDLLAAFLSFLCFFAALYGLELLRAVRRGNRAVSSAPPARPTFPAARNAPGARASLFTLNPNLIHS